MCTAAIVFAYTKFDWSREILQVFAKLFLESVTTRLVRGQVDKGWGDDSLFPIDGTNHFTSELGACVSHGKSC